MLAFARRYIPDETSAEDAVIDLFRRWLERPPRVRDFERLSAFLATSVYHAAIDWIRRDRAEQGQPPRPSTANPSTEGGHGFGGRTPIDPGPDVPRDVLAARLGSALSKLAGSDRLLLETHYGQALTVDECIALLRINRSAFHQRLH
jgi:RNA polymerase sigma factor (sigma-70 family)